jgi:hypothetical protein
MSREAPPLATASKDLRFKMDKDDKTIQCYCDRHTVDAEYLERGYNTNNRPHVHTIKLHHPFGLREDAQQYLFDMISGNQNIESLIVDCSSGSRIASKPSRNIPQSKRT